MKSKENEGWHWFPFVWGSQCDSFSDDDALFKPLSLISSFFCLIFLLFFALFLGSFSCFFFLFFLFFLFFFSADSWRLDQVIRIEHDLVFCSNSCFLVLFLPDLSSLSCWWVWAWKGLKRKVVVRLPVSWSQRERISMPRTRRGRHLSICVRILDWMKPWVSVTRLQTRARNQETSLLEDPWVPSWIMEHEMSPPPGQTLQSYSNSFRTSKNK